MALEQEQSIYNNVPPGFRLRHVLPGGHTSSVNSVAWSPDGAMLASGARDNTIRLWDVETGNEKYILEGHTADIDAVFFSPNTPFLASQSEDGTVRIWHINTGECVAIIQTNEEIICSYSLFHPTTSTLVTPGKRDFTIAIWDYDPGALYTALSDTPSTRYTNAKVVLVGDSGVGKSGLGLVLIGQPFVATESTHGRRVWTFESQPGDPTWQWRH